MEKYGIMVRKATGDKIVRLICFACRINQATNTHSEYIILVAFPLQQWLCNRASMLRLYVRCLPSSEMVTFTLLRYQCLYKTNSRTLIWDNLPHLCVDG